MHSTLIMPACKTFTVECCKQRAFMVQWALMLTKTQKSRVVKAVQKHDEDTGSASVQVALLTKKINELTSHLKKHVKDKHSRRGLLQMVADRRSHLKYLEKNDKSEYNKVTKSLGLKK